MQYALMASALEIGCWLLIASGAMHDLIVCHVLLMCKAELLTENWGNAHQVRRVCDTELHYAARFWQP